ncbi:hypothetical protein N2152v2_011074 [Parachlorella kessleri]
MGAPLQQGLALAGDGGGRTKRGWRAQAGPGASIAAPKLEGVEQAGWGFSSWEGLAGLEATHVVSVVNEAAKAMAKGMAVVGDDIPSLSERPLTFPPPNDAPSAARVLGGGGGAACGRGRATADGRWSFWSSEFSLLP